MLFFYRRFWLFKLSCLLFQNMSRTLLLKIWHFILLNWLYFVWLLKQLVKRKLIISFDRWFCTDFIVENQISICNMYRLWFGLLVNDRCLFKIFMSDKITWIKLILLSLKNGWICRGTCKLVWYKRWWATWHKRTLWSNLGELWLRSSRFYYLRCTASRQRCSSHILFHLLFLIN